MCAFPKTKLGAGVPCLPGTTLAMSPGGMGRAPPPGSEPVDWPPPGPLKERAMPTTHTTFPGAQPRVMRCSGRLGSPRGAAPISMPCPLPAPAPAREGGTQPGGVRSATELCLIRLVCPS